MTTVREADATALVLEFLAAGGHLEAARALERSAGVSVFADLGEELNFLRDLVLDGDWRHVEESLALFKENQDVFDGAKALFFVRRQRLFELVSASPPPGAKALRNAYSAVAKLRVADPDEIARLKSCIGQMSVTCQFPVWTQTQGRYEVFDSLLTTCGLANFVPASNRQRPSWPALSVLHSDTPQLYRVMANAAMAGSHPLPTKTQRKPHSHQPLEPPHGALQSPLLSGMGSGERRVATAPVSGQARYDICNEDSLSPYELAQDGATATRGIPEIMIEPMRRSNGSPTVSPSRTGPGQFGVQAGRVRAPVAFDVMIGDSRRAPHDLEFAQSIPPDVQRWADGEATLPQVRPRQRSRARPSSNRRPSSAQHRPLEHRMQNGQHSHDSGPPDAGAHFMAEPHYSSRRQEQGGPQNQASNRSKAQMPSKSRQIPISTLRSPRSDSMDRRDAVAWREDGHRETLDASEQTSPTARQPNARTLPSQYPHSGRSGAVRDIFVRRDSRNSDLSSDRDSDDGELQPSRVHRSSAPFNIIDGPAEARQIEVVTPNGVSDSDGLGAMDDQHSHAKKPKTSSYDLGHPMEMRERDHSHSRPRGSPSERKASISAVVSPSRLHGRAPAAHDALPRASEEADFKSQLEQLTAEVSQLKGELARRRHDDKPQNERLGDTADDLHGAEVANTTSQALQRHEQKHSPTKTQFDAGQHVHKPFAAKEFDTSKQNRSREKSPERVAQSFQNFSGAASGDEALPAQIPESLQVPSPIQVLEESDSHPNDNEGESKTGEVIEPASTRKIEPARASAPRRLSDSPSDAALDRRHSRQSTKMKDEQESQPRSVKRGDRLDFKVARHRGESPAGKRSKPSGMRTNATLSGGGPRFGSESELSSSPRQNQGGSQRSPDQMPKDMKGEETQNGDTKLAVETARSKPMETARSPKPWPVSYPDMRVAAFAPSLVQFHPCLSLIEDAHPVRAVALRGDGAKIAIGTNSKTISVSEYPGAKSVEQRGLDTAPLVEVVEHGTGSANFLKYTYERYAANGQPPRLHLANGLCSKSRAHHGSVYCLDWSCNATDGRSWLASGSNDKLVKIWSCEEDGTFANSPPVELAFHRSTVRAVRFFNQTSHSGMYLASVGGGAHGVYVWDVVQGVQVCALAGHSDSIFGLDAAEESGSQLLFTSSSDGSARCWDLRVPGGETARLIASSGSHQCAVHSIATHPQNTGSSLVATGQEDGVVKLWDLRARRVIREYHHHTQDVRSLAFHRSGWLLSGSFDGSVGLVDAEDVFLTDPIATFHGHLGKVLQVKWHPQDPVFVTTGSDGAAKLWSMASSP